jgi:AmiR/NasT family two-component response regulator
VAGGNPVERRMMVEILREMGAGRVSETASAEDADFECSVRPVDFVLWNVGWRGLDEVENFSDLAARSNRARPPVIAICSACSEAFMQEALRLKLSGVLLRPFSRGRLAAHIVRLERAQEQRFETPAGRLTIFKID